jgi:hypothetical protein
MKVWREKGLKLSSGPRTKTTETTHAQATDHTTTVFEIWDGVRAPRNMVVE